MWSSKTSNGKNIIGSSGICIFIAQGIIMNSIQWNANNSPTSHSTCYKISNPHMFSMKRALFSWPPALQLPVSTHLLPLCQCARNSQQMSQSNLTSQQTHKQPFSLPSAEVTTGFNCHLAYWPSTTMPTAWQLTLD